MICLKEYKSIIITLSVIALIAAGVVNYVKDLIGQPPDMPIPKEFTYNGSKIALAWTDDNTGENLIIQSDKKEYSGFNKVDVYFSITNISNKDQKTDIVIWLEDGKRSVEKMENIGSQRTQREGGSLSGAYAVQPLALNSAESSAYAPLASVASAAQSGRDAQQRRERAGGTKDIKGFTNGYAVKDKIESGETNFYKAIIKYPPLSKGEFFIEAKGDKGGYGFLDPWYSSSWTYKRAITLQGSKIATTTAGFPILATTTLADLKTTTNGGKVGNDSGYDIIFVDSDDSTLLNYEREKYASTTGEIAYWIKTDIASSTDKTIYMYYGNAGASDTATTTGVWDSNFVMVNHLAHNGIATTTYPDFLDSTKYANNGSSVNMNSADLVNGQVDGALDFDGVGDYVNVLNSTSINITGAITCSAWVYMVSAGWYPTVVSKAVGDQNFGYIFEFETTSRRINLYLENANESWVNIANTAVPLNNWTHIAATYNGINNIKYYFNGNPDGSFTVTGGAILGNTASLLIGKRVDGYLYTGLIDNVRVSNTARTAGWITTEWNNQSSVGSFMTIGAEVSSWPAVTTNPATLVASTVATANGNITNIGAATVTERGFKYGLTEADTWTVSEIGSFSAGVFKLEVPNLIVGTTYYIRAFAANADGTGYGSYVSFITLTEQTGSPIIFKKNTILKENVILK